MRWKFIILMPLLSLAASSAIANESAMRSDIEVQVNKYFFDGDFAKLDAMETDLINRRTRTESGIWKLSVFYLGLYKLVALNYSVSTAMPHTEKLLAEWSKAYPQAPAPRLAVVRFLLGQAQSVRGGDAASKTESWKLGIFEDYSRRAVEELLKFRDIGSRSPEWYALMEQAALGVGMEPENFDRLLASGAALAPDYYDLYFSAVDYKLPQWFGSRADLDELARGAAKNSGDIGAYARVYWRIQNAYYGNRIFKETDINWPLMKASMRKVASDYPSYWNYFHFMVVACLAHDDREVEHYQKLIPDPNQLPWKDAESRARCGYPASPGAAK